MADARFDAHLAELDALRLVVGTLLLVFGLQWLRKAILRTARPKALHDEEAIYREEVVVAVAVTPVVAHQSIAAWWLLALAVLGVLATSNARAARRSGR